MGAIHLIRKDDPKLPKIKPVKEMGIDVHSSGDWSLSLPRAKSLVGGRIYFHRHQEKPSFFGGTIEKVERSEAPDRIVFVFRYDSKSRGVTTPREGWAQEMKIVP